MIVLLNKSNKKLISSCYYASILVIIIISNPIYTYAATNPYLPHEPLDTSVAIDNSWIINIGIALVLYVIGIILLTISTILRSKLLKQNQ